ncbi:Metaxin-2, partial [Galemys pyrenaicus]
IAGSARGGGARTDRADAGHWEGSLGSVVAAPSGLSNPWRKTREAGLGMEAGTVPASLEAHLRVRLLAKVLPLRRELPERCFVPLRVGPPGTGVRGGGGEQILLSDNAASLAVQAFLQMCNLPIKVVCRANAEYMSPSGKVPFIHVGNQVVSELGPIVQFVKAKGHSLSDGLDEVQKAEMKAYMELVNNMLLTAELYLQWCDEATVGEITHARYGSPYPWPLNHILAYQKQWEVKRKMKAIGWGKKTLDQVLEDVDQCCEALSQRLGTQPYFFNKQPTELDALVFGHLYTIITTQLTNDELSEKVKHYSNLIAFCRRIEQHYFED